MPIPVIAVCIATFHREELLGQLIERLISQLTDGLFAFTIVVVDNSAEKSAMQVVQSWQSQYSESHWVVISYSHQPVKNIALTRNMAIDNACGDYLLS
ncbi:MAG: glycosyltransferase family 2 protein [Gammaproteobacteria bacterium]|nr:glycosyltransferase family 2 protein [Gammaproteobacteria bacterium]